MTRRRKERWEVIPENLRGAFCVWSRCDWRRIEVGLAVESGAMASGRTSTRKLAREIGASPSTVTAWADDWKMWRACLDSLGANGIIERIECGKKSRKVSRKTKQI